VPELQWVHQYEDADNMLGTFLTTIIFAVEAAIINQCLRYAQNELKWSVMALVHDGFNPMGKFSNTHNREQLDAFSTIAEQMCPGIGLRFIFKEFDMDVYDKRAGERLRTVEVPPAWIEEHDQDDDDELFQGDADFEPCYEVVKQRFEENVFKLSDNYVDLNTDPGRIQIMLRKVLLERYEETCFSEFSKGPKKGRTNVSFCLVG